MNQDLLIAAISFTIQVQIDLLDTPDSEITRLRQLEMDLHDAIKIPHRLHMIHDTSEALRHLITCAMKGPR